MRGFVVHAVSAVAVTSNCRRDRRVGGYSAEGTTARSPAATRSRISGTAARSRVMRGKVGNCAIFARWSVRRSTVAASTRDPASPRIPACEYVPSDCWLHGRGANTSCPSGASTRASAGSWARGPVGRARCDRSRSRGRRALDPLVLPPRRSASWPDRPQWRRQPPMYRTNTETGSRLAGRQV